MISLRFAPPIATRRIRCAPFIKLLEQRGELLVYSIEGTAFLRHMVRNIVGTLAEVGRGIRTAESFAELLDARDRTQAGYTAPPVGLYLVQVKYDPT